MRKILLITPFVPNNIGAGVNYTRLFIEDISKDCEVDIVLFKGKHDVSYMPCNSNVQLLKEVDISFLYKLLNVLFLFFLFPLFTAKFNICILFYLQNLVRRKKYDIVYFDFSQMFLYAKFLKHKNKILMSHDIITQRYSRSSNKLIEFFCFYTEKWVLNTSNAHIFTFSDKDSKLIYDYFKLPSISTSFYLSENILSSSPRFIDEYFVFFAMWKRSDNYEGLEWFLLNVLPDCSENIKFKIIGAGLNNKILEIISHIDNVEYLGFVENPYPIIANSIALISPLFTGAGVKVKVIEALACGTPIIGTRLSFEGIATDFSDFMIEAETPNDFLYVMKNTNLFFDKRVEFRKNFLLSYSNKQIKQYIYSLDM